MRKCYLQLKVFLVHLLIRMHIIKDVWYACEIELAEIEGKELYELFNRESDTE